MADLLWRQGHRGQALDLYRKLARERPEDPQITHRLAELEAAAASGGTMSFREHIQSIVDGVPGAIACTVMGFDGIAIDSYERGTAPVDIPTLLTEYSTAAQQLKRGSAQQPETGHVEELVVNTSNLVAVLRLLTEEYFLAVVLSSAGFVGKARYLMRVHAPLILKELG
jgi:predicted regulator of Ras-like GTPase activity (Roadblock/LC7/MglB family)